MEGSLRGSLNTDRQLKEENVGENDGNSQPQSMKG